ncbi:D-amino acid aminotransferase [Alkalimonas amylolytica]|uniref:Aminodeoxychorismate lyase n=1 Tax=Alkalimonas amylolytica TaxID=152573 RepID=A0A1H4BJI3_ALKAM|nr:D-amino acid aminotransferase [Alkalimonas amylolytica]SEA48188.1 D-alanine transaminase [Alkalimonas amylolytica]
MSIVYLNGDYLPAAEARISPMDRGFLFGDGIYEVVPSYQGRFVGLVPHMERMLSGLEQLSIDTGLNLADWQQLLTDLLAKNQSMGENLGIYVQVSRGTDVKRNHAFPANIQPTVFAFVFEIPPAPVADKDKAPRYRVVAADDLRWQRCHIKSTSLLGNVLHYQQGYAQGAQETILFNREGFLTEAAACNVFIVKDGVIATPPLSTELLPGITRLILLAILRKYSNYTVEERAISRAEVLAADEVWLTSSSKEVAPVVQINDQWVGDGEPGDIWLQVQTLFSAHKYEF